jgi:ornithine cyclodeaminase
MTHEDLLVLTRSDVARCIDQLDPVAVVARALDEHRRGDTTLPPEGYLPWSNSSDAYCRSLAMLGALTGTAGPRYGLKVINAATSNPELGIERAGGLMMMFDPETARPRILADASLISSTRTASYTVLSILHLGPREPVSVSLLGCGTQARRHLQLFERYLPSIRRANVFDILPARARQLAEWAATALEIEVVVAPTPRACVASSGLLLTATVSDEPYIPGSWFAEPTMVAHVSLDDLLPEVFKDAQAVYVDDLQLVTDNPRRILGALIASGAVSADASGPGARVQGTLAEVMAGTVPAQRPTYGHVVSNPFGMAILDVALAAEVWRAADADSLGHRWDLSQ